MKNITLENECCLFMMNNELCFGCLFPVGKVLYIYIFTVMTAARCYHFHVVCQSMCEFLTYSCFKAMLCQSVFIQV